MKTINFSAVEPAVTFDGDKKNNPLRLSEICFAGRSNVGKSSLINSLTNRKNIAKTSNKPGHTKNIFFYKIDQAFIIVDLPGYGYAKLAKKKKAFLSNLLFNYLTKRIELRIIFLLIDSRHGLKKNDIDFLEMLQNFGLHYAFLFTKTDKISFDKKEELKTNTSYENSFSNKKKFFTSAKTKEGIKELKTEIITLIQ